MGRVFVNGTFRLIHPGHLQLIQFAKRQGDWLIVGANTDEYILSHKGLVIFNESERVQLLYGVGADEVIIFGEPTPIEVVKAERPDVLVVSSQYSTDCPCCRFVLSYGGQIVQAPQFGDVSTSQILERCKRS